MKLSTKLKGAVATFALVLSAQAAAAAGHLEEITVAYFLEWPMPFQYAKVMGTYEEEMGVSINWVAFDTGTAMSAAMASGDVHISVSQGLPQNIRQFDPKSLAERLIVTGQHCYGCTAGAGSGCQGAIV